VTASERATDRSSDSLQPPEPDPPFRGFEATSRFGRARSDSALSRTWRRLASAIIHAGWHWTLEHGATGPDDAWAARFGSFGKGSCITFPPGAVFGERWIHLGEDTLIGPNVSISAGMVPGQQMVTDPVVRIGDRCMIGRGSHIVGHFHVEVGDDVYTGPSVYITDQNHGYENPDRVVHEQWPNDVPVRIGSGSWLGTRVVILPGTALGRNVVVGAGAVVKGIFPDHCVIAGVPARVVRRYVPGSGWINGTAEGTGVSPSSAAAGAVVGGAVVGGAVVGGAVVGGSAVDDPSAGARAVDEPAVDVPAVDEPAVDAPAAGRPAPDSAPLVGAATELGRLSSTETPVDAPGPGLPIP
jgi:acetyltransferase-like isoleucine patch superfamily enzyme